jgi:hypothetical protein
MVTELERASFGGGRIIAQFVGLSTDEKPSFVEPFITHLNGSTFYEMDTGNTYWFDEENCAWRKPGDVIEVEKPDFDGMTKAQLLEYASENGIEIDKSAKKADILEKVKE